MLFPGAELNGRYLLEELVATGGMGEVWRGVDPSLQRRVAVKVLLPSLVADAAFITRFRAEARMMAALRHPGIVQVYDYGQDVLPDGGMLDYLVMEFIDGIPLSTAVRQAGTLGAGRTLEIVAQAAEALQVAHEAGIVHRDVKPSNLLIRPGGTVVLVDFGLARSTTAAGITGTNVVMGTAHYMAPEQAEGKPVTPATDVYAVGASAYYCLAGRTPYLGDGPLEVLGQLVYGPSPSLPPGVPAQLAAVVMRAMDKDPARRYPSAATLAEAARSALQGTGSTGSARTTAARVALLGHDIPGATVGGHTTEPAAATRVGDRSGTGEPARARTGRRLFRTLAVLAAGVVIGAIWAATSIVWGVAEDAGQGAQGPGSGASIRPSATPSRGQPGSATASGTAEPSDNPASGDPATNPYVPTKLCGSDFRTIDSAPLRAGDTLLGSVYLLSDDTGTMCVVTLKTTELGEETPTSAYLEPDGDSRDIQDGDYKSYAGPVRDSTDGQCIRWGGSVDDASFDSPLGHCQ